MNLTAPIFLLGFPVLAALVTLVICRWQRVTVAAGVLLLGLLWTWLRFGSLDDGVESWLIFGRTLTLHDDVRALFLVLVIGLGALFLLSLLRPQGHHFVPAGLGLLSPLAAMLMVRPFALSVSFWLITAGVLAVFIQSGRVGQTEAGLRFLVIAVLSTPLLLVVNWMMEANQVSMQMIAGRLLALAVVILLAGFPFHIWVKPLIVDSSFLAAIFLVSLVQLALLFFFYRLLAANPWLQTEPSWIGLLRWSSGLAALFAGLLALTAGDYGRLVGSLLLLDMAVSLGMFLWSLDGGWETAVSLPIFRFVSLLLIALGVSGIQSYRLDGRYEDFRGWGLRLPLETAVFAFGILSLLGLPLTVGFAGRWRAISLIAQQSEVGILLPTVWLLATGGGIYGVWRGLSPLIAEVETASDVGKQMSWRWAILAVGLSGGVTITIWPQLIFSYAGRLAGLLSLVAS